VGGQKALDGLHGLGAVPQERLRGYDN
jgi:hypothetical protein